MKSDFGKYWILRQPQIVFWQLPQKTYKNSLSYFHLLTSSLQQTNPLKTAEVTVFALAICSEIKLKEMDGRNPSYYNQRDSTFILS